MKIIFKYVHTYIRIICRTYELAHRKICSEFFFNLSIHLNWNSELIETNLLQLILITLEYDVTAVLST
jgi:hypothetical protein